MTAPLTWAVKTQLVAQFRAGTVDVTESGQHAFNLAACYALGFGVRMCVEEAFRYLELFREPKLCSCKSPLGSVQLQWIKLTQRKNGNNVQGYQSISGHIGERAPPSSFSTTLHGSHQEFLQKTNCADVSLPDDYC